MTTVPAWNRIKTRLEELGYSLTLEQFRNLDIEITIHEEGRCSYTSESRIRGDLDTLVDVDDVLLYDTDEDDLQCRISDSLRDSGDIYEGQVINTDYEDHDIDEIYIHTLIYSVTMEDGQRVELNSRDITELIQKLGEE